MFQTVLAAIIGTTLLLSGCGNTEKPAQGGTASSGTEVIMKINGQEIVADELGFFIANAASLKGYANGEEVDWNQNGEDGKRLGDSIKEQAVNALIGNVLVAQLGEKNGAALTDDEKKQIDGMIGQVRTTNGEEYLQLALEASGVSSEDGFKTAYSLMKSYSKAASDMGTNRDKYIKPEDTEMLGKYKSDEKASVQHILIMNDSEKHEDPKAAIDEVLRRAKAGEDFNALMTEFNEDPGEGPGGYSFGRGEMVPEFETASFALDYNEISDVVKSDYGYHVIKRLVGATELEASLAEDAVIEKNEDAFNSVTTEGVMVNVNSAISKLMAMQEEAK